MGYATRWIPGGCWRGKANSERWKKPGIDYEDGGPRNGPPHPPICVSIERSSIVSATSVFLLFLTLQEELRHFGDDGAGALVELGFRQVCDRMGHHQEAVGGQAPLDRHGPSGLLEHVGHDRGGRNAGLLEHDAVEHTARRAGPSITDACDDDVAGLAHLLDDLLVRRHTGVALAPHLGGRRPILLDQEVADLL